MLVDSGTLERVNVGDLDAFEELHREHAARRELAIDFGDDHVGIRGEVAAHRRGVVGLVDEVQLHRDVLERLAHQDAIVEVALELREPVEHRGHVAEIGADDAVDTRILNLDGASTAVVEARRMHLRERSRRQRRRIELGVDSLERAAKFALDLLADHRKRPRRNAIVQAGERRDPFVGEHVGASRDELACLDEQTFKAERGAVEGLRGAEILAAEQLSFVAIVDKARPELRAFVACVHVGGEPHHVREAPCAGREPGFGHVGGKVEAAVEAGVNHTESWDRVQSGAG